MTIRFPISFAFLCVCIAGRLPSNTAIWQMIEEVDRNVTPVCDALAPISDLSKSVQFHP
jgi:hypothetical protein